MSEPKPLNPTEQDALVKQIGLTLMRAAPEEWRQVVAEYRATGRYFELAAELKLADGSVHGWAPPQDVAALFARLRAGMHREGRGSWSNARYQLDHPSSYNLDFDRAEPKWQTPPPQQAYVDEMRYFPRADENVPDWLRRRLGPPPQQRTFRTARVFDGAGPNGRPSVNRPPVPEHEVQPLLDYLTGAPVAVVGRGFDPDVLAADTPSVVPAAFQTDGNWIWPAAVGHYLRAHGVPPETELVERARAAGFELPEVPEEARLAAAANLGAPAAPPNTPLPVAEVPVAEVVPEPQETVEVVAPEQESTQLMEPVDLAEPVAEEEPAVQEEPEQQPEELTDQNVLIEDTANLPAVELPEGPPYRVTFDEDGRPAQVDDRRLRDTFVDGMDLFAPHADDLPEQDALQDTMAWSPDQLEESTGQDTMAWSPLDEAEPEDEAEVTEEHPVVEEEPEPTLAELVEEDVPAPEPQRVELTTEFQAVEPEPEPEPRVVTPDEDREIGSARRALDDLNVPSGAYRIGGEQVDRTWNLRLDGDAWEVAWFDHGPKHPMRFERVEDASAYLIGKLVLGNFRTVPPRPQRPLVNGFRDEPRRPVLPPRPPEQVRPPEPVREEPASAAKRSWPIAPMNSEPPLTLFRHKQMFELPVGTEVDRYGDPNGNLAYVAGTPFPERSLVPSWINRPYRVYRLRRPIEVLTGVAVPWFDQPGGGTAYLFPKSLEDMVADGALVEITSDVHSTTKP